MKRAPCPSSDSDPDPAAVEFDVVFHDGQAQPGAFVAGGEVGLEDAFAQVRGHAGAVVLDDHQGGEVLALPGADPEVAPALERFAGVLEDVHERIVQVVALGQDDPADPRRSRGGPAISYLHRRGEDPGDGVLDFLLEIQLLDAALDELGVAHQLGDEPVGLFDLLPDDLDLLGDGLALLDGLLERVGGGVDDGERILELVGDLGRQAPGGRQLFAPHHQFALFLRGAAPASSMQCLQPVAPEGHRQQQQAGAGRTDARGRRPP